MRLSVVKRSLLNTYSLLSCTEITIRTTTHEQNSKSDPNDTLIAGMQVSVAENLEITASPITKESAMKNGKGIILDDCKVVVRFSVVELVVLVSFVLLLVGSAQVVPEATVPLGQDVIHWPWYA